MGRILKGFLRLSPDSQLLLGAGVVGTGIVSAFAIVAGIVYIL